MNKRFTNFFFLIIILLALIGIIRNPRLSLESGYRGLLTWFNIIIPSLLPFFIVSEILRNIGFVDFLGKLLKPLMKFLFNVPGVSAFPFSMSLASGYPMGAKIVSDLRMNNTLSRIEAERTICFSSTSGPLFMLGAVSIGMLNNPAVAPLIIYPHYLGAITIGFILSFYKRDKEPSTITRKKIKNKNNIIVKINVDFSIGQVLNNSVRNGLNSITLIGGFIIFYSVLTELLFASKFFNHFIESTINTIPLNIDSDIIKGFIAGILELTTGCRLISNANISLVHKVLIINFLIGWSGFSIHSQVLSFINNTDIDSKIYIFSKFLHGLLASFYGFILYSIKYKDLIKPSFLPRVIEPGIFFLSSWPIFLINSFKVAILSIISLLILSLLVTIIHSLFDRG